MLTSLPSSGEPAIFRNTSYTWQSICLPETSRQGEVCGCAERFFGAPAPTLHLRLKFSNTLVVLHSFDLPVPSSGPLLRGVSVLRLKCMLYLGQYKHSFR